MNLEPAVFVSAIAACISAVSAFIAVWNYRREQLNQRIAAAKWKKEYFSDLLKWSDEAMFLLSESLHMCDLDPKWMEGNEFFETQHALRVKLSAQIDRGRWFFPNYAVGQHGAHKSEAFRGYRPAVLDGLVDAYRAVSSIKYVEQSQNRQHRSAIETAKRLFTSEIQKVLDPRSRDVEFRKLLSNVAAA
ncbi:MAG: hypothetical protein JO171_00710 [Paludibacterium sp.]|uniref:hypothetical protein n=1 Tax=Paludibacterium sp. TaxID=1917523 RepID=UPI0025EF13E7|nr:hypothetical protein [Paludibacterium sp.]MBV8045644.1 hypothetical protein [Paludibacterium sp.]MBV8647526.1 hypothetical protein [Paludibacterium sp.]